MLPAKFVRLSLGEALAASTDVWTPDGDPCTVYLVAAPFTPSETIDGIDLTLAAFTGSTGKGVPAPPEQAGIDPATQEQVVTVLAPAGGWRWECTAAPGAPETIYGFVILGTDHHKMVGCQLLPAPVTIAAAGDFIDLGTIEIRFVLRPLS